MVTADFTAIFVISAMRELPALRFAGKLEPVRRGMDRRDRRSYVLYVTEKGGELRTNGKM